MAAHRIYLYLGRLLTAGLVVSVLIASEHHGVVLSSGLPIPGATVTATLGDKKLVTTTDAQGAYSFHDLPDGNWTIRVEMLGFAPLTKEIGIAPDAPSPQWDLQLLNLAAIRQSIAPKPAAQPAVTATAAQPKPARRCQQTAAVETRTPARQNGGRGAGNQRPSLRQAMQQQSGIPAHGCQPGRRQFSDQQRHRVQHRHERRSKQQLVGFDDGERQRQPRPGYAPAVRLVRRARRARRHDGRTRRHDGAGRRRPRRA